MVRRRDRGRGMNLWVDKYYKVKGEHIDALRCYVALLIEELNEQNYGNVKNHAIRINNVIGEIFRSLKEAEDETIGIEPKGRYRAEE